MTRLRLYSFPLYSLGAFFGTWELVFPVRTTSEGKIFGLHQTESKDKRIPAALPPVQRPWPGHCVLHLRPLRLCHLALSCCHCYCCSRRRHRCSLSPVGPLAQRPRLISVLPSPRLRRGPCGAWRPPTPPPPPPSAVSVSGAPPPSLPPQPSVPVPAVQRRPSA